MSMIHQNTFHSELQTHCVVERTSGPLIPFFHDNSLCVKTAFNFSASSLVLVLLISNGNA